MCGIGGFAAIDRGLSAEPVVPATAIDVDRLSDERALLGLLKGFPLAARNDPAAMLVMASSAPNWKKWLANQGIFAITLHRSITVAARKQGTVTAPRASASPTSSRPLVWQDGGTRLQPALPLAATIRRGSS